MTTIRCLLLALAATLAGCQGAAVAPQPADPARVSAARSLVGQARYAEAAAAYLALAADTTGQPAALFKLDAAASRIAGGNPDAARDILSDVAKDRPQGLVGVRLRLLSGELALLDGLPERALEQLPESLLAGADRLTASHVRELRAQAYARVGNGIESARERVELDLLLDRQDAIEANRATLWRDLGELAPVALEQGRPPPPDTLGGWMALAALVREYGHGAHDELLERVRSWQAQYPGHPANQAILPEALERSAEVSRPPTRVALLLPFEGPFADAAAAVRDGFMAAWYADSANPNRPAVRVRDTAVESVSTVYARVVEEGADVVVGPLRKEAVRELASVAELPVPTLALNQIGQDEAGVRAPLELPPGLIQFSLAPEHEARAAARRAWSAGYRTMAMLAPVGDWGQRVAEAFSSEWEALGGQLTESQFYESDSGKLSATVEALLNVDASEQRARQMRQLLARKIHHVTEPRHDTDAVFLAAFPISARQLRPLLEFHHAGDVPVFSTSHLYAGRPNPTEDVDLDGIVFGDMPWIVSGDAASRAPVLLRAEVERAWPRRASTFGRLFAFGVDAYGLVPRVRSFAHAESGTFEGVTGGLFVTGRRELGRELEWARFENGVPVPWTPEPLPQ